MTFIEEVRESSNVIQNRKDKFLYHIKEDIKYAATQGSFEVSYYLSNKSLDSMGILIPSEVFAAFEHAASYLKSEGFTVESKLDTYWTLRISW